MVCWLGLVLRQERGKMKQEEAKVQMTHEDTASSFKFLVWLSRKDDKKNLHLIKFLKNKLELHRGHVAMGQYIMKMVTGYLMFLLSHHKC